MIRTEPPTLSPSGDTATLRVAANSKRRRTQFKRTSFLAIVLPTLLVASVAAIAVGSTAVDWQVVVRVIGAKLLPFWIDGSNVARADQVIVWLIRVPRVLVAILVGGGLAVAGALLQGLFRNPLAEPTIVGVGQGAMLGAVAAFVTGLAARSVLSLPLAAFLGSLLTLMATYAIATRGGVTPMAALLLSGIAVGALLSAVASLLISMNLVSWSVAQEILFWTMGGLDRRTWTHVWISAPFILFSIAVSLYYARDLDLLLQGEETAAALGVDVETTKRIMMAAAALLTGSTVAVAGIVGFVGLIVPHLVRLMVGPSHRVLLPAVALTGSAFVVLCDLLARTLVRPAEIRLGIVTAAFGAPFFLYLLVRKYRESEL